jgi:hypothetical protein
MSHGITMVDNVVVNSYGAGLWWDIGDRTNDLLVDSMVVMGVHMPRAITGTIPDEDAYSLGAGINMEVRNSVAVGTRGSKITNGFDWPDGGQVGMPAAWVFEKGNVAHNNQGSGLRFWTNSDEQHFVSDYVGYRNGRSVQPYSYAGIETGAYLAMVHFTNTLILDEHLLQQANARTGAGHNGLTIEAFDAPAVVVGHRNLGAETHLVMEDCSLTAGAGHPKVWVGEPTNFSHPWLVDFRRCNVTPEDVEFASLGGGNEGSIILLEHTDGRKWEVRVERGRKLVRSR